MINRQLIATGINVRGTGSAQAVDALSIGIADDSLTPPLPGLVSLVLELSYWNGLTTGTADTQAVAAGVVGASAGNFFTLGPVNSMPLAVGRTLPTAATPADGTYSGYVPIYTALASSSTQRIVGFGAVQVVVTNGGTQASITRQVGRVGAENVSAVVCYPISLSSAESTEVLSFDVEEALRAPASQSLGP